MTINNPLEVVVLELKKKSRHLMSAVDRSFERFGSSWVSEFNEVIGLAFPTEQQIIDATQGYAAFCNQSMRAQAAFQQSGRYAHETFASVASTVYFDQHYMHTQYLPGLLLSHFLWPHHYAQLSFYREIIRARRPSLFAEVGVGTGIFSLFTLLQSSGARGVGVDISVSSLEFASQILSRANLLPRFQTYEADITAHQLPLKPDLLVSVELLEHLEDPLKFLLGVRRTVGDNGHAFISAAISAAHADHIFLYRSKDDVRHQLEQSGFKVANSFFERAYEQKRQDELVPAIAAFHVIGA